MFCIQLRDIFYKVLSIPLKEFEESDLHFLKTKVLAFVAGLGSKTELILMRLE